MARKPMATRNEIAQIAESFRDELARLHRQMDWPTYKQSRINLQVTFSEDKPVWEIQCTPGDTWGTAVKGSDLGVVMDEVYRRLGYEHREQGRIETSMAALPAPSEEIEPAPKKG
jgi:aspartyl-tRNA synthetase